MLHVSRLKKVLVGATFAGAFFFAAPAANAATADPAAALSDAASSLNAAFNSAVDTALADAPAEVQEQVSTAQRQAETQAAALQNQVQTQAAAVQSQAETQVAQYAETVGAAPAGGADESGQPLTNPNPIGLQQIEEATQPEFRPAAVDPNYVWKNDTFSKVAAMKPEADFVLHRVPGSYYDAPRIPEESNRAMNRDHSLYGPGTPIYIGQDTMCTLTVAGHDAAGRAVGITAGHCGNVGEQVSSADSWQVGPTGTVVDKNESMDYSVIEFNENAEVSKSYNGVTAHGVGGTVAPGEVACKRGLATGTTCGMVLLNNNGPVQVNQVCAMVGDSGAPLFKRGRVVGLITGGTGPVSCRTPWQGALHSPTEATNLDAVVADMNRRGGVGSGFTVA